MDNQPHSNCKRQPLDQKRIGSKPLGSTKSGHQPADTHSYKNKRQPHEPEQTEIDQGLSHMIFAEVKHTQANWCTEAEAQQEFGIRRIEGLKPRSDPDEKDGRGHEETAEEDQEECVA